jgi:hypothetical protein
MSFPRNTHLGIPIAAKPASNRTGVGARSSVSGAPLASVGPSAARTQGAALGVAKRKSEDAAARSVSAAASGGRGAAVRALATLANLLRRRGTGAPSVAHSFSRLRLALAALSALIVPLALTAAPASAAFGVHDFDFTFTNADNSTATQAGSHPFGITNTFVFNSVEDEVLKEPTTEGDFRSLFASLPAGLVADRDAVAQCTIAEFRPPGGEVPLCGRSTIVGVADVEIPNPGIIQHVAVFNLVPPPGVVAEIAFAAYGIPVTVELGISPRPPYNGFARVSNAPQVFPIYSSKLTLWGVPADPVHDAERILASDPTGAGGPAGEPERPFLTLPRSCTGPLPSTFDFTSWQGDTFTQTIETHDELGRPQGLGGCDQLRFAPTISSHPTTAAAETPSGLDFDIDVDDPRLSEPDANADSDIRKAVVALPAGVTTNSSVAAGLGACSQARFESETIDSASGTGCPEDSKIGSVEVESPLLEDAGGTPEVLDGSIYVAKQHDNQFDNLLTIDMVIKDPGHGILIRLAGSVEPDPTTGQLTTTFDDLPQLPFSHFHLHFREGRRAPLLTPSTCGSYATEADLYPWAEGAPVVHETATFTVDSAAKGGACATSAAQLPNAPTFSAGTLDPAAGAYSPFVLRLSREDGSQQLARISTTLPQGLLGKLAGIPYCSDAQIAGALARGGEGQGATELAVPSCPLGSEVGTVTVAAGAGPEPLYVSGHAYLAGPYKGAPLSLEILTPAIAGPFDLGAVAVRTALQVDPATAQITAVSDPIPTILHGLPLDVRSIAIDMGRPSFTLNPTSCEPKSILGSATSTLGSVAPLSQYFQASSCAALGFKPKLALSLKGGTRRHTFPALKATLTYPQKGAYANIAKAQVTLPQSEFLEQDHIGTVCTNPQFAAGACPKASIYGFAEATSPLLDKPLKGPVYLRTPGHTLPDLVADLKGQIEVTLRGRVDTGKGGGIRNTFEAVPDAPVSKFTLNLYGGKKGLLVNSENICAKHAKTKAIANFTAQNGRVYNTAPTIANSCGRKSK